MATPVLQDTGAAILVPLYLAAVPGHRISMPASNKHATIIPLWFSLSAVQLSRLLAFSTVISYVVIGFKCLPVS